MKNKNDDFKVELENQYNILIKAENKEQKKRATIIITILVITLCATIITLIFAVKAYKLTNVIEKEIDSTTYYRTLAISYNNDNNLDIDSIVSYYELEPAKVITITNEGTQDITYNIKLTSVTTNLLSTNSLVYTLTNEQDTFSKELPLQEGVLAENQVISPETTVTYVLKVNYNGAIDATGTPYNYHAKIEIEQIDNKVDLLN